MLLCCKEKKSLVKSKKRVVVILFFVMLLLSFGQKTVIASDRTAEDIERELNEHINSQIADIDFSEFEWLVSDLNEEQANIFGSFSFKDKVMSILGGDFGTEYNSIFQAIISLLFSEIISLIPLFAGIISISVLCSILNNLRARNSNSGSIVYFACFGGVILITSYVILSAVNLTRATVGTMQTQMDAAFPILLTIMTALGSVHSVAVYQPLTAILSKTVVNIMVGVILPIFIISYVFNIISNLNPSIRLTRFSKWLSSLSKWIIGITFTIFSAFMAVQGMTAAVYDGISVKTAKYAISHYIPIVGGFLSDGFNLLLAGSVLIKNAVGLGGIILLIATVLFPVIQILALKLILSLVGAILEPLNDRGFGSFLTGVSESLNQLIAIILTVAFMYFIFLILVVCTSNYVF